MLRLIGSLSLIMIWLLMAISSMAQTPAVLDTDGQPLRRGVEYYVLPAATDTAGGLTLVDRNGSCPSYVGQEPLATVVSPGLAVTFAPRNPGETIISEGNDFSVTFSALSTCIQNTIWSISPEEDPETSRRFIVTGSSEADYFSISRNQLRGLYTIGWCPACPFDPPAVCPRPRCGSAGVLVQNGTRFLALDGPAFPFVFRRADQANLHQNI